MKSRSKHTELSQLQTKHSSTFLSLLKTYSIFNEPTLDIDPTVVDRLNVILTTIYHKSNNIDDNDSRFVWIDTIFKQSLFTSKSANQTHYLDLLIDNGYIVQVHADRQTKFKKSYLCVQLTDKAANNINDDTALPHPVFNKITKSYINYYLNVIGEWRIKLWNNTNPFYIDVPDEHTFMTEWQLGFDKFIITHPDSNQDNYTAEGLRTYCNIKRYNDLSPLSKLHTMSIDPFGKRFHSFLTRIPKRLRSSIKHPESTETFVEIDLAQSQPTILAQLLYYKMGSNKFTTAIQDTNSSGSRIYNTMTTDTIDYDDAKTLFMKSIFGTKIDSNVFQSFGQEVIDNLSTFKHNCADTYYLELCNNSSKYKLRNALCSIMQRVESSIMKRIYKAIDDELGVRYFTVHDCIAVESQNVDQVIAICNRIALEILPDVLPRFEAHLFNTNEEVIKVIEDVEDVIEEDVVIVKDELDELDKLDELVLDVLSNDSTNSKPFKFDPIKTATDVPDDLDDLIID